MVNLIFYSEEFGLITVSQVYYGSIVSVISSNKGSVRSLAERLGKLHEDAKVKIFYRRNGDYIRSVLVPSEYPEKVLEAVEAASLSSDLVIHVGESPTWTEGELALLATSLNVPVKVVSTLPEDRIRKLFKGTVLERAEVLQQLEEWEGRTEDRGVVYVDRSFVVKGVGVVVTGFSLTQVKVHDKLTLLPSMKEVEVKSIQVLDEDQEAVGPGVRVGLALRNVKEDEVKDSYLLTKSGLRVQKEFEGRATLFPWAQVGEGQLHFVAYGVSITGTLKLDGDRAKIALSSPLPLAPRLTVLNVNSKLGKPRVAGFVEL
jgi:selenocysteine-specific translation elongation factor